MATMVASPLSIDTNVLMYATDTLSPWHSVVRDWLNTSRQKGIDLVISPQILREYLAATTRAGQTGPGVPLAQVVQTCVSFARSSRSWKTIPRCWTT